MKSITLDIVTQEKRLVTEEVDSVSIETIEGELTILPDHQPIMTRLSEGILYYTQGKVKNYVAIFGGFLEVGENSKVNVLADSAVRADDIDLAKLEKAKSDAEKALQDKTSDRDFALAEATLRRTTLELRALHKQHSSSGSSPQL